MQVGGKVTLKSRIPGVLRHFDEVVENVLNESSERVATKWKSRVRVDKGEYRDSITSRRVGQRRYRAESDVAHSIPNEFGTSRMAAQPDARQSAAEEVPLMQRSAERRARKLKLL